MKQTHNTLWVSCLFCLALIGLPACGGDEESSESPSAGGDAVEAGRSADDGGSSSSRPNRAGEAGGDGADDGPSGGLSSGGTMGAGGQMGPVSGGQDVGGRGVCDCPRALVCDDANVCQEVSPCTDDQECQAGRICVDGECADGCSDNVDCRMQSPETPQCADGRCVECLEDEHCPGNTTCNDASNTCEESAVCEESADCLPGRSCLDGTCQGDPECPATPCYADRVCIESSGQCVPNTSGPCETNENCAAPFVCAGQGNRARCGRCTDDAQCGPNRTCEPLGLGGMTRCTEPDVCDADEQCSRGRVCAAGRCGPPADCADDMYDTGELANDSKADAAMLSFASHDALVSCGNDEDWYRVELDAGYDLEVEVRQAAPDGANYSLIVEDETGDLRIESVTDGQDEALKVSAVDDRQRILFIKVDQAGDVVNGAYRLDLRRVEADAGACSDGVEESAGAGDDSPETGRLIRNPGELCFAEDGRDGVLCPGDDDYLCFFGPERGQAPVGERTVIRVRIRFGGGVAVIGTVLNSNGDPLPNAEGRWTSQDDSAEIVFPSAPGRHCLQLRGELMGGQGGMSAASVDYTVEFSTRSNTIQGLCDDGQVVVMSEQGNGVYVGGVDEISLARESVMHSVCGGTSATQGEKVFLVEVSPNTVLPALLTATVGNPEGAVNRLQDPMVSIRRECAQSCSEAACSTGQVDADNPLIDRTTPAIARTIVSRPGTYAVIADGFDGGVQPSVSLDVRLEPAPSLSNDQCGDEETLELRAGRNEFEVNLHQASDAVTGCAGPGSVDALYTIEVDTPTQISVRPRSAGQPSFAVSAFLADACGAVSPMACGAGFEMVLEPGIYTLGIEGYGPNARGAVTVDVWSAPVPEPAANDACVSAEALTLEGNRTLRSDTRGSTDDIRLLDFNPLTRRNTNGGDLVYRFSNLPNQKIYVEATPLPIDGLPVGDVGWDLALYAFVDCENPSSANSRISGSDGALSESIVFNGNDGDPIFVVVDGSNGEEGPFELRWGIVECQANEDCDEGLTCQRFACSSP